MKSSLLEADDEAARRFVPDALRRRRAAAHRLEPLSNGSVDPRAPTATREPSSYSLTETELRRHANDLVLSGWSLEEVLLRLAVRPRSTCACACSR